MGLSEGKRKQRLVGSASTKNTTWANDSSLPGQKLLSSMGWSKGQGLGNQDNQGSTSHVAVAYKMDNKGIGAHRREKEERLNGRADTWEGAGGDLGGLFERLNRQAEEQRATLGSDDAESSESSSSDEEEEEEEEKKREKKKRKLDKKDKDGKKSDKGKEKLSKEEKKAQKKLEKAAARVQKKEAKKARKEEKGTIVEEELIKSGKDPKDKKEKKKVLEKKNDKVEAAVNVRMASRAKFLRAKRMVGTDALSVNEILGISASSSKTNSPLQSGTSTPITLTDLTPTIDSDSKPSTTSNSDSEKDKKSKKRKRKEDQDQDQDQSKDEKKKKKDSKKDKKSKSKSDSDEDADKVPVQSFKDPNKISLPISSDPSLSASPLNPVSQLSVQAYLSQKLMRKRAEIAKRKREDDEGVWSRVDQSVRAL